MKLTKYLILILSVCSFAMFSCKKQPHFTIEGTIKDAKGDMLYLERRGFTDVSIIDSVKIDESGSFSVEGSAPEYPDLYMLRLGNQSVNLAIDSIETIQLQASKALFATDYSIEGSPASMNMKTIVVAQNKLTKDLGELKNKYQSKALSDNEFLSEITASLSTYKDMVKKIIVSDTKSPAAYFALFQKIEGELIFNPYEKSDSRIYSAVATAWDFYYKDTPRAKYLHDFTLSSISARRKEEKKTNVWDNIPQASSGIEYYNIELPDIRGQKRSLTSLQGKVVLLDFTAYQAEYSPVHNMTINKVYEKHKANLEVFQVSFDSDTHFWQNAASNLPWICVRDAASMSSDLIYKFNLQQLPTIYLFNRQGEIAKRLSPGDDIEAEIKKLF